LLSDLRGRFLRPDWVGCVAATGLAEQAAGHPAEPAGGALLFLGVDGHPPEDLAVENAGGLGIESHRGGRGVGPAQDQPRGDRDGTGLGLVEVGRG
jgi:hypothetical protein